MTQFSKYKTFHFIGIGGIGMSAIARILLEKNYRVTGSDLKESVTTLRLKELGGTIFLGHSESNLRLADIVVVSSAVDEDNEELKKARDERLPVVSRAEMLQFVISSFKKSIAVAGTHGKTTTSSFIVSILELAKHYPTYLIGGELLDFGSNAALGEGPYLVAEADESDGSFLELQPQHAVLTNLEPEHMEYFKTEERLNTHFKRFMSGVIDRGGYLVVNNDDPRLMAIASAFPEEHYVTIGIENSATIMAEDIQYIEGGVQYTLLIRGELQGQVQCRVMGRHNVYNSLAAIGVALQEGVSIDIIKKGLFRFSGTKRRFQFVGERRGIAIYDDYAHHPTEIKTTLEGMKKGYDARIVCIFQPHRYSRTRDLLELFPAAFNDADIVIITDIYSAHEEKISGLSGEFITQKMDKSIFEKVLFIPKKSAITRTILPFLEEGDMVVTMGAGDIYTVGKELYKRLNTNTVQSSVQEVVHGQ